MNGARDSSAALAAILVGICVVLPSGHAPASASLATGSSSAGSIVSAGRADTLWIFDADFETLGGCNEGIGDLGQEGDESTGWFTFDFSEHPSIGSQWHRDGFHAYPDGDAPDVSYWCGRPEACWPTAGYGDNWRQLLWRDVDLTSVTSGSVELSFRQRVGLESGYDYGYVDLAVIDGGQPGNFETVYSVSNVPFGSTPGSQVDWDHWDPSLAHPAVDISAWAGHAVRLRWRLESDEAYSSERWMHCNTHSGLEDGGWYIDEVAVKHDGDVVFYADFEDSLAPGNTGWETADGAREQAGIVWQRVSADSVAAAPSRPRSSDWVVAAVDPQTGQAKDGQWATIVTPPFGISGIADYDDMVLELTGYFDLPTEADTYIRMRVSTGDSADCLGSRSSFCEALSQPVFFGGWQTVAFPLQPEYVGAMLSGSHMRLSIDQVRSSIGGVPAAGLALDRLRVGTTGEIGTSVPSGSPQAHSALSLAAVSPFAPGGLLCSVHGLTGPAVVDVMDPAGRRVRRVAEVGAGDSRGVDVQWDGLSADGRPVAQGLYFVRVESEGSVLTAKTVVLR